MAEAGGHWVKGGMASPGEARAFIPSRLAGNGEVREIEATLAERFKDLAALQKGGDAGTAASERSMIRKEIAYYRGQLQQKIQGTAPAGPSAAAGKVPSWATTPKKQEQWRRVQEMRERPGFKSGDRLAAEAKAKAKADFEESSRRLRGRERITTADVARGRKKPGSNWTGD